MPKTYEIQAQGFDREYLVKVIDPNGTGTVQVPEERQFIRFNMGQGDAYRLPGPKETQLDLAAINDAGLESIIGADGSTPAREGDVALIVEDPSSSRRFFQGLVYPHETQWSPLGLGDDVLTLRATDGTALLENYDYDDLSISSYERPTIYEVLEACLNVPYEQSPITLNPIKLEIGLQWAPEGYTDTERVAGDLPLQYMRYHRGNFREDRSKEAGWLNCEDVLGSVLTEFNMTCQQAPAQVKPSSTPRPLRWHVRQPDAFGPGTYAFMGLWDDQTYEGSVGMGVDLQSLLDSNRVELSNTGTMERPRAGVTAVHDHTAVDNYLQNGGFEERFFGWGVNTRNGTSVGVTFFEKKTIDGGTFNPVVDASKTPNETENNTRLGYLRVDASIASGDQFMLRQRQRVIFPTQEDALRMRWSGVRDGDDAKLLARLKVQKEDSQGGWNTQYGLGTQSIIPRSGVGTGTVSLPVQPLGAPVVAGGKLPVYSTEQPATVFKSDFEGFVEVVERAEAGDTVLVCETDFEIKSGYGLKSPVFYPLSGGYTILTDLQPPDTWDAWSTQQIYAPLTATDGTRVVGDAVTLDLGMLLTTGGGEEYWGVDDVSVAPVRDGRTMTETRAEAEVATPGKTDELETRAGGGPTTHSTAATLGERFYEVEKDILTVGGDSFLVSGDHTTDFPTQSSFEVIERAGEHTSNAGIYKVKSSALENGDTRINVFSRLNITDTEGVIGTKQGAAGVGVTDRYDGLRWQEDNGVGDPIPITALSAQQRLRYHRGANKVIELVEVLTEAAPRMWGAQVFEYDGDLYTVESITTTPTRGTRKIKLLELTDYGLN